MVEVGGGFGRDAGGGDEGAGGGEDELGVVWEVDLGKGKLAGCAVLGMGVCGMLTCMQPSAKYQIPTLPIR